MATFPTLTPSGRSFTPGRHPHSEIGTLDGLQTRVRTSNVLLEQRLRLTFTALTESEMLSVRSHYNGQQGRFLSFDIPTSLLSGMAAPVSFTPTGYSWIYAGSPQIEDIGLQRYNVNVELITVPPEGANINGSEFEISINLTAGSVVVDASVAGASQTVTISFAAGIVADNTSAGFDLTVSTSLAAGTASGGAPVLTIGAAYAGGYFAGYISHTANGVATHALVVAPRATGRSGTGYTLTTNYQYKTSNTTVPVGFSQFDGRANTDALIAAGIATYPAAQFCVNLNIGGFTDWYLPSEFELEILYTNLKPDTTANNTGVGQTSAVNAYAVPPRAVQYTAGNPTQTTATDFQAGGTQAILTAQPHWSSTATSGFNRADVIRFTDGTNTLSEVNSIAVRFTVAIRRVAL